VGRFVSPTLFSYIYRVNEAGTFPIVNLKIKVMMSQESVYDAKQEFDRFEKIMNTQLYLTKEEYDFCFSYDKDIREDTSYVGDSYGDYLNLRLYTEHDHEKKEYEY
jgi:hypothetical protein